MDDLLLRAKTSQDLDRVLKETIKAMTVFIMMVFPQVKGSGKSDVQVVEGYPQISELEAIVRAFKKFRNQPFRLITDSAYVAEIAMRAKQAFLKEVSTQNLYILLSKFVYLISHRKQQFHVIHVRSRTDFPGVIAEGNRRADTLEMPLEVRTCLTPFNRQKHFISITTKTSLLF